MTPPTTMLLLASARGSRRDRGHWGAPACGLDLGNIGHAVIFKHRPGAEGLLLAAEIEIERTWGRRRAGRAEARESAVRCAGDLNRRCCFPRQPIALRGRLSRLRGPDSYIEYKREATRFDPGAIDTVL